MYLTHNSGKSVIVQRCIRILNNKIYKYMNSVSKNLYIGKLYQIVKKNTTIQVIVQPKRNVLM